VPPNDAAIDAYLGTVSEVCDAISYLSANSTMQSAQTTLIQLVHCPSLRVDRVVEKKDIHFLYPPSDLFDVLR